MTRSNFAARRWPACALLAWIGVVGVAGAVPPGYVATPVGTLGGSYTRGLGINANGDVVGESSLPGDTLRHAFVYTGETLRDLRSLGGGNSVARGINASGQITGTTDMPSGYPHAFLYADGVMRDLGSPDGGAYESAGYAINDDGVIAGSTFASEISAAYYVYSAFIYSGGQMQLQGSGIAFAINASGVIAGTTSVRLRPSHPFIDVNGASLSIPAFQAFQGSAYAVNANGEVTGAFLDQGAFLYSRGAVSIIAGLDGGASINSAGDIVGSGHTSNGGQARAKLYSDGHVYDLNDLVFAGLGGMTLHDATAINDRGQIVANGCDASGGTCMAFRLDPAVRPETAAAVEFYNSTLDHYFVTHLDNEIARLDAGTAIKGWVRTGLSFTVYVLPRPELSPVCRFYMPPGSGDSHFYGRGVDECASTAASHPEFIEEDPQFFYVTLPVQGDCRVGERPLYRVFNDRADANHRYTVDPAIRDRMVEEGWVAEGDGPDRVAMCVPG